MWIEGLNYNMAYITIDGQHQPKIKIDHSFAYPGMAEGVCWSAQVRCTIAVTSLPFSVCALKNGMSNQEVYLSEQSVNECVSSLLLKIDSHHQQLL